MERLRISHIISTKETFGATPGSAIGNVFYYTGLQTGFIGAYIAIAGKFGSKKDNKVMAISGALVNGLMLTLVSMAILSRMPDIASERIPILTMISDSFGAGSFFHVLYSACLFLAYVTTADVVAATSRFGVLINRSKKHNQVVVDFFLAFVLLSCSVTLAQFGVVALVNTGYKFLSLIRGPIYIAGGLIFAPIALRKIRKSRLKEAK